MNTAAENSNVTLHPWRPVFWEPVSGTSERLMVGVVYEFSGEIKATRILRDDVLCCLYGKSADGALKLIDAGLKMLESIANAAGIESAGVSVMGLTGGQQRATAATSAGELLRDAALLYSSLANLDAIDEQDESDAPQQEEVSKRFSTEVREDVITRRPDLHDYFGRMARLVEGGEPVKFGFCSPRSVIHFGVLHPIRQGQSVRDARAKLWEVSRAMDMAGMQNGALVWAVPRDDDPVLGSKQRDMIRRNQDEIEREADRYEMRFLPVTSVSAGADKVIEFA